MKRAVGTIFFGLGVLFVVLAVGLPLYVAPSVTKLPYDLAESTSVVEAKNATYPVKSSTGVELKTGGTLTSTTNVKPRADLTNEKQNELKDQAVIWDVYSTTKDGSGNLISASTTEIALDRVSGAAYPWNGAFVDTKPVKFTGHMYKFPFDTEKNDYPYWDAERGDSSIPAKFEAEDNVDGVKVYRFKQTIPWMKATSVSSSDADTLAGILTKGASKTGEVWYSNTRTFWVEPVTGQFLKLREQRKQELRDSTGTKLSPLLDADFNYSKETVDKSVEGASGNKTLLQAVSLWGPIGLGVLAVILLVAGVAMARSKPTYASSGQHRDY